jgi:transcriptional regulator of acetoin/glycerol metabolism
MKERTRTETQLEGGGRDGGPRLPGLVLVFQRGACALVAHAVDAPRTIGRGSESDLVIDDPGVSRQHARVEPAPGGFLVTDLGSHNGVYVDQAKVSQPRHFARHGSVLRLGKCLVIAAADVVRFAGPPPDEDGILVQSSFAARAGGAMTKLVGGPSLAELRARVEMAASAPSPVLVEGETGSGKELVAQAIHAASRRTGDFVGLNCAALPSDLVESELFGHARGAFSGSSGARVGLFRSASGGTLLLDEISELPLPAQAKLLRVIETSEVRAVGEDRAARVDVRLVAATNRDLLAMSQAGEFRADLLHRLAVMKIPVPALRERLEDVPRLCEYFLDGQKLGLSVQAMQLLLARPWPGNVRELKNVVSAAALRAKRDGSEDIRAEDVGSVLSDVAGGGDDATERVRILEAMGAAGGNVTRAARALGIARSGLYETLKRMKIDPQTFRK